MRSVLRIHRRGSAGFLCALLAATTLLGWSLALAENTFAPIYRAGVSDSPAAPSSSTASESPRRYLFVIAGDVRAPGVFYTDRTTVTADELIERAGGSSTMYEPMVHRVNGVRVVETLSQRDASHWELAEGEILRVVGSVGVRDARVKPLTTTTGSHVVCLGLAEFPVLVQLPEGRTTLNDLFGIVGQSPEIALTTLILPVRVDSRGITPELDPGTLVIFPSELVNQSAIPAGVMSPTAPLDPDAELDEPDSSPGTEGTTLLPGSIDRSVPELLPSPSDTAPATTSPLFVPAPTSGPTASTVPFMGGLSTMRVSSGAGSSDLLTASTHEVSLSHSVETANAIMVPRNASQNVTQAASVNVSEEPITAARRTHNVSQVAIYTAVIAVVCLSLAGIWTYWDRMRSIATLQSFTHESARQGDAPSSRSTMRVDHVQALIDNRVPIVEETVEAPKPRQFQGEAWGQRRLRLDNMQPLAGPHAAFHTQPSESRRSSLDATHVDVLVHSESDERQLQRVMALLTAEQSRAGKRRPLVRVTANEESDCQQSEESSRRTRESSLERALRQVMRKGRS